MTTRHIWARGSLTVARGGSLARLRGTPGFPIGDQPRRVRALSEDGEVELDHGPRKAATGPRRPIRGFSRRSRGRQIQLVASINWRALRCLPLFVTLTYPGQYPADPARWKADLQALCRRLERKYGERAILWRLELQKRGAPHFHLLVFDVPFIAKQWLSRAWYEVVGSGDARHRRMGTRVERIESWRGVMHYVAKYVAKVADEGDETQETLKIGRHWGIRNAPQLPRELLEVELDGDAFHRVRRVLKALARARGRHWAIRGRWAGGWTFVEEDTQRKLLVVAGAEWPAEWAREDAGDGP